MQFYYLMLTRYLAGSDDTYQKILAKQAKAEEGDDVT
jgi:ferritin-like protein